MNWIGRISPAEALAGKKPRASRDFRLRTAIALIAGLIALGYLVQQLPSRGVEAKKSLPTLLTSLGFEGLSNRPTSAPRDEVELLPEPAQIQPSAARDRANTLLKDANRLIREKQHEQAIRQLHDQHELLKDDPRAYYYLAKALMARGDPALARDFYQRSIDLYPQMPDAYFGYAEAAEAQGDLESALGGMRAFIHVSKDADPYRLRIAQARSAIWEWEAKLGRGPWGPTKGIPPGFTADEIKRDGRGVGIKMQKPETLRPDGTMDSEMKAQSKFNIFKRE